jgi:hypothetical protein
MSDEELRKLTLVTQRGFDTLADLLRETNGKVDANAAAIRDLGGRVDETNVRLGRLEGRFDNLIEIAGGET